MQAGTIWLTTPSLDIDGGEIAANVLHADLTTINGLGRLYGVRWLDVDIHGDFTYANGQRFESDGLLDLTVDGTLTHQGTLQTAGELALTAGNLTNQGVINATNCRRHRLGQDQRGWRTRQPARRASGRRHGDGDRARCNQ